MILDLIVILLIIVLSFLFCMNNPDKKNKYNCNITHIVVGLTAIVFYKLVIYYKVISEPFTVAQSLNDFIDGNLNQALNEQPSTLNDTKLTNYTNKMSELIDELQQLKNTARRDDASISAPGMKIFTTLGLEAQQQAQQLQIQYLTNQIKNAQDIINTETISSTSQNYKPIKVFSSCVLTADGTLTKDQPVNNNISSLTPLDSVVNSPAATQIASTVSQTSTMLSKLFNL